ncbi:MAG: hypothetical protein ACFFDN_52745, partial [Candidatus Hodarchaeota archaeon]
MKKSRGLARFILYMFETYDIIIFIFFLILLSPVKFFRDSSLPAPHHPPTCGYGCFYDVPPFDEIMWIHGSNVKKTFYGVKFTHGSYIIEGSRISGGLNSLYFSGNTEFKEPIKTAHISSFNDGFLVVYNVSSEMNLTIWAYDFSHIIISKSKLITIHAQDHALIEIIGNSTIEKISCKGYSQVGIRNSTINFLVLSESAGITVLDSNINKISVYDRSNLAILGDSKINILKDGIFTDTSLNISSTKILTQNSITSNLIIGSYRNTTQIDGISNVIHRYWTHIAAYGSGNVKIENYSYNGSVPLNIRAYNNIKIELKNVTSKNNIIGFTNGKIEAFDSSNITIFGNSSFGKLFKYHDGTVKIVNSSLNELVLKLMKPNKITVANSSINLVKVSGKTHFISENTNINRLKYGLYCISGTLKFNENGIVGQYINTTEIINGHISFSELSFLDCYHSSSVYLSNIRDSYRLNINIWHASKLYITNCRTAFNITNNDISYCIIQDSSIFKTTGWKNSKVYIYNSQISEANAFYLINTKYKGGGLFTIENSNIEIATSIFRKYSTEHLEHPISEYPPDTSETPWWKQLFILKILTYREGSAFSIFLIVNCHIVSFSVVYFIYYNTKIKRGPKHNLKKISEVCSIEPISFLCPTCDHENAINKIECSSCHIEFPLCIICNQPIPLVELVQCPYCNTPFHNEEFLEWLKIKSGCPSCKQKLKLCEFQG